MTACGTVSFDITTKTQGLVVDGCPRLKEYTREQQTAVANELELLPRDAMTRVFIADYGGLRDQVRACRETVKQQLEEATS